MQRVMATASQPSPATFSSMVATALFAASASHGVPIDLSDATPSVTGPTTLHFDGVSTMASIYWGDVEWNENTNKFEVYAHGEAIDNYSMNFNGTDNFISIGAYNKLEGLKTASWSFWLKPEAEVGSTIIYNPSAADPPGNLASVFLIRLTPEFNEMELSVGTGSYFHRADVSALNYDEWNHVLWCRDGNIYPQSDIARCFLNGQEITPETNNGGNAFPEALGKTNIGRHENSLYSRFMHGHIDDLAIWDTDQRDNAAKIYNHGVPHRLDQLDSPPIDWWRMGNDATFREPQWLLPNHANKNAASNYSMRFDGSDDYITTSMDLTSVDFTNSFWIRAYPWAITHPGRFAMNIGGVGANDSYGRIHTGKIMCQTTDEAGQNRDDYYPDVTITDGNWHNIVFTYKNTTSQIFAYIDGVNYQWKKYDGGSLHPSVTLNPSGNLQFSHPDKAFMGNIDEVAVWKSILTPSEITDIYNSGVPTDLSALNPESHWKMGEMAYRTNQWSIPDQGGAGNTGSSVDMEIKDRTGDAPNSTNNALSYNMNVNDRVPDTPGP